jgi:hypothetical protein
MSAILMVLEDGRKATELRDELREVVGRRRVGLGVRRGIIFEAVIRWLSARVSSSDLDILS